LLSLSNILQKEKNATAKCAFFIYSG